MSRQASAEIALKAKLFEILLDNARKLPTTAAGNVQGVATQSVRDIQGLQSILLEAAKAKFLTDYKIEFDGNATRPADLAVGREGDVRATSAIYHLDDDHIDLKTFIESNILSAIEFTRKNVKFAADDARSTLEKELTDILKNSTGTNLNNWVSAAFSKTYVNPAVNENSLRSISVVLYTNAELKEGPSATKVKSISYLGVYYHVPSPDEAALNALLAKWYDNASRLYDPPNLKHFAPPYTMQGLQKILDDWAKFKFKDVFLTEYEGDDTKPKDIIPPGQFLTSTLDTVVIKNDEWDDLADRIEIQIISCLDIPEWLNDTALAELKTSFLSVKNGSVDGSIHSTSFNKVYKDPVETQGRNWKSLAVLTFSNGLASGGGSTITRTFINYIGVFYPISE